MGGNELSSQLMGFTGKKQSSRNVTWKVVYRELQATIIMLHIMFFNSPDDLRAKAFAKHAHEPNTPPLDMSLRQAYANFMADHLVKPGKAGMKKLIYVGEGNSPGKKSPTGVAAVRAKFRQKEYKKCNRGEDGCDWRKCIPVLDECIQDIRQEIDRRQGKHGVCEIGIFVPPGEADAYLAEVAKDENNVVCIDSNDGDIGLHFWHRNDNATAHYKCKWEIGGAKGDKVVLWSIITTPKIVY